MSLIFSNVLFVRKYWFLKKSDFDVYGRTHVYHLSRCTHVHVKSVYICTLYEVGMFLKFKTIARKCRQHNQNSSKHETKKKNR